MRQKFRYAIILLMSQIALNCDSSGELASRAREKESQGNTAEALYYYDLALRENSENFTANKNLGILLAESGQAPGSAALYLEKALKKDPKNPEILLYLLEIYLKAGSKAETDSVLKGFSESWDKDRESLAQFLTSCILESKKNPSERKRFQENRIPASNPASSRLFKLCEEKVYEESHPK
ncbi:tetratricopeptide repeat protein [Leptospira langatensis]|uniref:Tetratricopeptide repeat protein n=1 Tax=Leptospira langatensis TaxID=2484983 RepID=A0A5F1ZPB6_9LEPT|nr:tetratricopeptide repeat protein [Leptospira langatensis]TGK05542.1 tetratricopeptide repeat protein [Leptospira langatensis]TGL38675.1 tetratricopeptide repeat protein [Leptospira langatensis]